MYRILAIDYGEKNIGLAISDPLRMIPKPYKTLKNEGLDSLTNEINNLIVCENIGKVLLGLPLSVAGLDTQKLLKLEKSFLLQNRIEAPLCFGTNVIAHQMQRIF